MRTEHRLFAHHYIISGDKEKAYRFVYPKASGESLKVNARRLLRRKEIREFVDRELTANAQQVLAARLAEQERCIAEEYATLDLVRRKLRAIISGEHKVRRYFKYKNHIEVVEEDCSPTAILRAIDVDLKVVKQFFALKNATAQGVGGKTAGTGGKVSPPTGGTKGGGEPEGAYSLPLPPMREGHAIPMSLQLQEVMQIGEEAFFDKHYGPDYMPALRAKNIKERPWMEQVYKERGERVLEYIPTEEEFLAMRGVHAYNKKLEQARREEAKRLRQSGQGIPGNPDGTVDIPEVIPSTRDIAPMSIPELFPEDEDISQTDNTTSPPGGAGGASSPLKILPLNLAKRSHEQKRVTQEVPHKRGAEDVHSRRTDNPLSPAGGGVRRGGRGWNTQHGNPQSAITTHKIIINTPENEQNDLPRRGVGTKDDDDPGFPPGLLANPFFKQPDPSLKGKITPMAFTRPTTRKEYTRQEIEEMLAKEWEKVMNDPNSAFNDPDGEYYIPPQNRGTHYTNPYTPPPPAGDQAENNDGA